jgi:hypothetical protein
MNLNKTDANLCIKHIFTKIHYTYPIHKLPKLIEELKITKIVFYDDIIGTELQIRMNAKNLQIFGNKLKLQRLTFGCCI